MYMWYIMYDELEHMCMHMLHVNMNMYDMSHVDMDMAT